MRLRATNDGNGVEPARKGVGVVWLCAGMALLAVAAFSGCSAAKHKRWADSQVQRIIDAGETNVFGRTNAFTIDTVWSARKPAEISADEILKDRTLEGTNVVTVADALKIGAANSRTYQLRKESLFLAALNLTREQYNFWPIPFVNSTAAYNRNSDGSQNYSMDNRVGVDQFLRTGGQISAVLVNDIVAYFSGGRPNLAVSEMSLNFVQPLMRGAGAAVVGENLLQSERDVIYAVRDFSRFQDTFSVSVISAYLRVLQQQDVLNNEWKNYTAAVLSKERSEAQGADRLPRVQVDQARQRALTERNRYLGAVQSYRARVDSFKELLGIPLTVDLRFDPEAITALKAVGLPPVGISEGEAFRVAVQRRLDLLNEIDRFEDSKRKIIVAANLLETQLDFFGGVSVDSLPPTDYANFQWEDFRANAGLRLNLPIDRLRERNVYRTTFINFERQLRQLGLALDNLRSGVRETIRDLELLEASYTIQKRSVELADSRVESAELLLQAGRVQVRDLLEAQNDQLRARNAFTVALIDYHVRRLEFLQDLGLLNINEEQFWLRATLPDLNDPVPPPSIPVAPEDVPVSPEQIIGLR